MGTIFLAGGGDGNDSFNIDEEFSNAINIDKPILYLPIAMDGKNPSYEQCENWFKSVYSKFNCPAVEMITAESELKKIDLKSYSAVYIGGGNTFSLLRKFYHSGLINKTVEFIKNDGVIYGGSAGAIIIGKDIMTSHCENLENFHSKGFDLLNGYSVWCHYKKDENEDIIEYEKNYHSPVIALSEKSGLCIENEFVHFIGTENIIICKNGNISEHFVNEKIRLSDL